MSTSTLPAPAQQAAQSALSAAIADSIPPTTGTELEAGQVDEEPSEVVSAVSEDEEDAQEQVVELEGSAPAGLDADRTVFEDAKTFNVKVRALVGKVLLGWE